MRFTVLGPVAVVVEGERHSLPRAQTRGLLALLLLNAGRPVSRDAVIEALWGGAAPLTARAQIHNALRTVRSTLSALGAPDAIITGPFGYQATISPELIDAAAFDRLLGCARQSAADGQDAAAAAQFREAVALWHGEPLSDAAGAFVLAARARLIERRLTAIEELADAELRLGRAAGVVADLTPEVEAHPLRERLRSRLMTALCHSGRGAEALQSYRAYRARLAEEQGLDPGREIVELERSILRGDLAPSAPPKAAPKAGAVPGVVPAQLPLDLRAFSGRTAELGRLDAAVDGARTGAGATLVLALTGTAGVGKTTLAVHWARRRSPEFPDGQLYVNLRGFDPEGPMSPSEALRSLLDGLGVAARRVPADLPSQAALYRSVLDGRRVLVVLDNAVDAAQVRPLLPGAPGCLALTTSRNPLQSLVVAEGAIPIRLDLLDADEARDLLVRRVGADRIAAEPAAVADLVAATAGLPLALALVAARAAVAPEVALSAIAQEVDRSRGSLAALRSEDPAVDPGAVFSWSYRMVSPAAGRLFRLLGLHPGPDISAPAAASLAGLPPAEVVPLLLELQGASLIREHVPGRYTSHDLLRAYAHDLTRQADDEPERRAALHRMFDHYLHTGHRAAVLFTPQRESLPLTAPQAGVTPEDVADNAAAAVWLAAERPVILAAVLRAEPGFDTHRWQLAWTMVDFLDLGGMWPDMEAIHLAALAAAERLDDPVARAVSHRGLGRSYSRRGRSEEAMPHFRATYRYFGEAGDSLGQARIQLFISMVHGQQGRWEEALTEAQGALERSRAIGNEPSVARALGNIAWYSTHLGRHAEAIEYGEQSLEIAQRTSRIDDEAACWDTLGTAHARLGHYDKAVSCFKNAIAIVERTGSILDRARGLEHLGDTYLAAGDLDAVRAAWTRAHDLYQGVEHHGAASVAERLAALDREDDASHEGAARGRP